MENSLSVLKAKYIWIDETTPGIELYVQAKVNSKTIDGIIHIGESSNFILNKGFVNYSVTTEELAQVISDVLPPVKFEEIESVAYNATNDENIMQYARHFFDAVNHRNGEKFIAGETFTI